MRFHVVDINGGRGGRGGGNIVARNPRINRHGQLKLGWEPTSIDVGGDARDGVGAEFRSACLTELRIHRVSRQLCELIPAIKTFAPIVR